MTLEVHISYEAEKDFWNETLLQNKNSMTYQTHNWQIVFQQVYDSKPFFIYVNNNSGSIVGQLAGVIHKKWLWRDSNSLTKIIGHKLGLGSIIHWFYGPIIHDKINQEEIMELILNAVEEVAVKNDVLMIRGTSPPLEEDLSISCFKKQKYEFENGSTFIIDLTVGIDDLYNALKKDTRYYIRQSEKLGLTFEVVKSRDSYQEFQQLKMNAFKLEGRRPSDNPTTHFDKHWELLYKDGLEQLFVARKDGKNMGGILTLKFQKHMIQHALVNSPEMDLVGMFLTWNTIKWAMENGYETFDFAGVNPNPQTQKEKGIYFYASKWGGKLYSYYDCKKFLNKKKYRLSYGIKHPKTVKKFFRSNMK